MKIMSVMPAAAASSTAYWISGLSTIGSISFGLALVTGRKRLPRPATGKTAFVMGSCLPVRGEAPGDERTQSILVEHRQSEGLGLGELAAGIRAGDDVIG